MDDKFQSWFRIYPLLALFFYANHLFSDTPTPSASANEKLVPPCKSYLTARHIEHEGVGYDEGYSTIEGLVFPASSPNRVFPFIDLRLHRFDNNEYAANAGFGLRGGAFNDKVFFGLNTYFDYRSDHFHRFHFTQIGLGFETLSKALDFRVNGYFPLKREETIRRCVFDQFIGGFFMIKRRVEVALTGVNAEIGRTLTKSHAASVYGAIGPYYYGGDVCRHAFGGKFRLHVIFSDFFFIDGIVTHDSLYKTRAQGQMGFTFSLGCAGKNQNKHNRLSQPVERNEIIVLDKYCKWRTNF
ncbi:MAG: inverse autotransporter beta domain-containing protein [Rhabdochlamydiaceae bacterium]|nr:inverse autotransporter beta domain-containing protein [Rhabdochlamydiaceae bacterium]